MFPLKQKMLPELPDKAIQNSRLRNMKEALEKNCDNTISSEHKPPFLQTQSKLAFDSKPWEENICNNPF